MHTVDAAIGFRGVEFEQSPMKEKPTPRVKIEETKNRHSRAVLHEQTIVIRLARGLSESQRRAHIESLVRRMTRMLAREQLITTVRPLQPLLDGERSLTLTPVLGKPCTIELEPGKRARIKKTRAGWRVTVSPRARRQALHRLLWKLLAEHCRKETEDFMDDLNDRTLRVSWSRLRFGYASSQWGSCGANGVIMLNAVLLFTHINLLRYVIVHEFAHRLVRGHTKKFWQEVERGCPDHKVLRARLRKMRIGRL